MMVLLKFLVLVIGILDAGLTRPQVVHVMCSDTTCAYVEGATTMDPCEPHRMAL